MRTSVSAPQITRLYLLRHGQVEATWRGKIYGDLDVALSERGRRDAQRCARQLENVDLAGVLSSGLRRSDYGAAQLTRDRELVPVVEPRLREIDRGAWRGHTFAEIDRDHAGSWSRWSKAPEHRAPVSGESLADLARRVRPALEHWADRFAGREWAAVGHSWVVRVAVCDALGLDLNQAPRLDIRTGSINVLERLAPGRWLCAGTNLDHVPALGTWRGGASPK